MSSKEAEGGWSFWRIGRGPWLFASGASLAFLHVMGWLSLQFRLAALGVATDISALDGRYLFEGALVIQRLVTTLPVLVVGGLVVLLLGFLMARTVPRVWRRRVLVVGHRYPYRVALLGVVLQILVIEVFLRQCLQHFDLLLRPELRSPSWTFHRVLDTVLLSHQDHLTSFLTFLFALVMVSAVPLMMVRKPLHRLAEARRFGARALHVLLWALLVIEVGFLSVNHGVLTTDRPVPRVTSVGAEGALSAGEEAWIVWQSPESVTYLLLGAPPEGAGGCRQRWLRTLPAKEVGTIQVVAFEEPLSVLHRERFEPCR